MKRTNDLGNDSIPRLVLRLAIPAMVAQLVNVLYGIVDRMYIGNIPGIGETALAGAGNCEIGLISYTGTGKSGDSAPTTVTFPKMPAGFFLCGAETYLVVRGGDDHALMIYYTGSTTYVSQMQVSWKGNQFQISSSKPTYQLNEEGVPYWGLAFYQKS